VLNVAGYFAALMSFLDQAVDEGFIKHEHRTMLLIEESPEALLDRIEAYQPLKIDKAAWILEMAKR
jgi:predicted Rossmann-fold nucleotide-binding protein